MAITAQPTGGTGVTAQKRLMPVGPATAGMNPREQAAYTLLQHRPDGVTSTELGQSLHIALKSPCACNPSTICKWAKSTGETVGAQLRRREIAFKRAHTRWTLTVAARPHDTGELPDGF